MFVFFLVFCFSTPHHGLFLFLTDIISALATSSALHMSIAFERVKSPSLQRYLSCTLLDLISLTILCKMRPYWVFLNTRLSLIFQISQTTNDSLVICFHRKKFFKNLFLVSNIRRYYSPFSQYDQFKFHNLKATSM